MSGGRNSSKQHLMAAIAAVFAAFFCLHFTISTKQSPRQPIEGQVQLNSHITYSQIEAGGAKFGQYAWRGNWEVFTSDSWAIGGILQIPLNSPGNSRNDFVGLGLNWHYFQLGDLDFSASAHGMLTVVSAPPAGQSGAYGGALIELNALLIGDHFLYGVYYHLIAGAGYHVNAFDAAGYSFDEMIYKVGIGWTI